MLKKILPLLLCLLLLTACSPAGSAGNGEDEDIISIVATTYPVYLFASEVTRGVDGVTVSLMINQGLSCLHNYTLTTNDMKLLEGADVVMLNGAGLDDFVLTSMADTDALLIDCSVDIQPIDYARSHGDGEPGDYDELEVDLASAGQEEEANLDPHFWMDPARAAVMVETIAAQLSDYDETNAAVYQENSESAVSLLAEARAAINTRMNTLFCRELITFHDGFSYFAEAFNLTILMAVEEEEGQEASAKVIQEAITLIDAYGLPAIFTEVNSSDATAQAIARESDVTVYTLNMIMSGDMEKPGIAAYLSAMNENVNSILRALQ